MKGVIVCAVKLYISPTVMLSIPIADWLPISIIFFTTLLETIFGLLSFLAIISISKGGKSSKGKLVVPEFEKLKDNYDIVWELEGSSQ